MPGGVRTLPERRRDGGRHGRSLRRHRQLHRDRRPDARGQCGDRARTSASRQGRTRHGQDDPRLRDRPVAIGAADPVAHQIDDEGAAGTLRIRRRCSAARLAARRGARARHPQLHRLGASVGSFYLRRPAGPADRRDRQGRYRVPQRSAARARPHGVSRLRNQRDGGRPAAADRRHHLEQREGAAGRVSAALLLPLHPLSRPRHHAPYRRRALPRHPEAAGRRSADGILRDARGAGPEEEAVDLGVSRLDQAADDRGHPAGGVARRTMRAS